LSDRYTEEPYKPAIDKLKEIPRLLSPVHKLKAITKCVELVHNCVQNFYLENGINKEVKLNADDILSIFIFIIAKANLQNLIAEC
jgi:hypothetical protein